MTRFEDGPAAGKFLELQRAPLFLRVCIGSEGTLDALDQLHDEPCDNETLYAYRREGEVSTCFIDYTDKVTRRRRGKCVQSARYRLCLEQPDNGTMRDRVRWQEWCKAAYEKERAT